jgi:hypothetical protein
MLLFELVIKGVVYRGIFCRIYGRLVKDHGLVSASRI